MKRTLFLSLFAICLSFFARAQSTTTLVNELRMYRAEVDSLCRLASYGVSNLNAPIPVLAIRDTGNSSLVSSTSPVPYERVFFIEMEDFDLVKIAVREKGDRPLTRIFYFRDNKLVYASQEVIHVQGSTTAVSFRELYAWRDREMWQRNESTPAFRKEHRAYLKPDLIQLAYTYKALLGEEKKELQ